MAESSRLQGLHQVAKKLIIRGRPALERVSVLTDFPSRLRSITAGSWDFAGDCWAKVAILARRKRKGNRTFFISIWREIGGYGRARRNILDFSKIISEFFCKMSEISGKKSEILVTTLGDFRLNST